MAEVSSYDRDHMRPAMPKILTEGFFCLFGFLKLKMSSGP